MRGGARMVFRQMPPSKPTPCPHPEWAKVEVTTGDLAEDGTRVMVTTASCRLCRALTVLRIYREEGARSTSL